MSRPRSLVAALLGAALLLTGCGIGNDVDDYIERTYPLQNRVGDAEVYTSSAPVGTTTATIAAAVPPAARATQGASEYLRYDDDIVIVSAAPGGSTIRVEELEGRYRGGFYAFLGPGFRPGSPAAGAGGGGPGDVK